MNDITPAESSCSLEDMELVLSNVTTSDSEQEDEIEVSIYELCI